MADKGGMAEICMVGYFLTPNPQATLEDYLNHLGHAVKVCGIDHVGMSTDFAIRGRVATTDREVFMKSRPEYFKPSYDPRWAWGAPELDNVDRYRTAPCPRREPDGSAVAPTPVGRAVSPIARRAAT